MPNPDIQTAERSLQERLPYALRALRVAQGYTQVELAAALTKHLGTITKNQAYISQVECGHTNPSSQRLEELCKTLGIPVELLYFDALFVGITLAPHEQEIMASARTLIAKLFMPPAE